jgi:hypothetical protein
MHDPRSGTAMCKAALCKLLGVKDGTGKVVDCLRTTCSFCHPTALSEVTLLEAQAAARVEVGDSATMTGMRAKTKAGSRGWKTA